MVCWGQVLVQEALRVVQRLALRWVLR